MSNIHSLEPQTFGLITFETTFGNLDIELFTKQCPKATRNFVQLCLDGYYEQTIFDRVEKDFIAVGGVPPSGDENSDKQNKETFPDEFHSRLKFTRRGLLATANTTKNDNGPKFFFTLGPAPELHNKHTIFGRIKGNSIYSLVELNDCQVDQDFRPYSERKITKVLVIENPFADLVPRLRERDEQSKVEDSESDSDDPLLRPKLDPSKYKKLSFYNDDDEDDEDEDKKTVVSEVKAPSNGEQKVDTKRRLDLRPGIDSPDSDRSEVRKGCDRETNETKTNNEEESVLNFEDDGIDAKEKRLREIRAQIQSIKQQIETETETKTLSERRQAESSCDTSAQNASVGKSNDSNSLQSKKRSISRERETLDMLANFKKKLKEASTNHKSNVNTSEKEINIDDELSCLDTIDDDEWLNHKFEAVDDVRLAKDANTKGDDWYTVDDPRNPMNRRYAHDQSHDHKSSRKRDTSSSGSHRDHHKSRTRYHPA